MSFMSRMSLIKGAVLAIIAVAALVWDALDARIWNGGSFEPRILAEHLLGLGINLESLQAGVQRYVDADLWDQIFVPVLLTPSLYIFGAFAIALIILGYAMRPRRS